MEQRYFSMKEFRAFVIEVTGRVRLRWLAFSGDVLNETDSAELQQMLGEFFRERNHHSFRKHGT